MMRQRGWSALVVVLGLIAVTVVPVWSQGEGDVGGGSWGLLRYARNDSGGVGELLRYARNDGAGVVPASVWEEARSEGQVDVLVVLRDGVDGVDVPAGTDRLARGELVHETLWQAASEAQRALRAELDRRGVEYRAFYVVNAIQLTADEALLRMLAGRRDVERIVPNTAVPGIPRGEVATAASVAQGVEPNLVRIHADDVWALGYRGEGVVVAGQDTGYDWDHPALIGQYRGWDGSSATHDYNWHDAIHVNDGHTTPGNPCGFDSPVPCDDYGHGTHTMGTMAGDDGGANQIGVAPGARWIGCRNMEQGWGTPATYLECFDFFLAPYPVGGTPDEGVPALAPHVVNNSWGCPSTEGCDPDAIALLDEAVSELRQAGIVVVASAGNNGSACETVVHPPAIARDAVSVGAFDHATNQIASFSSRGPVTDAQGTHLKPDLAAPGVGVRSSVPGGIYGQMSGTSMAAPHVVGAVALLLSAAPSYAGNVDAIEAALTSTAAPRTTSQGCGGDGSDSVPNNVWGWGTLDVLAAVQWASTGTVMGQVVDAVEGWPVVGAEVVAQLEGWASVRGTAYTDASGTYSLTLPVGSYQLSVDASRYLPEVETGVPVTAGMVTRVDVALEPALVYYIPLVVR